ncbi:hypothetical protein ABT010_40085 [Streptomyces sp. NPDC002668]|uniref:hypothetical protein n=1 Tax=Streptomyces sp. NPDC002668 TaxID=3154422 RepID=UPI00331B4FFC
MSDLLWDDVEVAVPAAQPSERRHRLLGGHAGVELTSPRRRTRRRHVVSKVRVEGHLV